MKKRSLIAGLLTIPFFSGFAYAQKAKSAGKYVVPTDVNLIRVRSFLGDKEVLDTNFKVNPGQVFIIEAVKE